MKICPSQKHAGRIGVAGHAGIGHAFSHSGFFQEDSGGFAVLLTLLKRAMPLDITIESAELDAAGSVLVRTAGGGCGSAHANGGFTPYEAEMMAGAAGLCCAAPQTLASRVYGRVCGQGTFAQSAAFSLALARAMLDTVRRRWEGPVLWAPDDLPGSCGEFLGGTLELEGAPVSWLLTINASQGGDGPNEDSEGCVPVGNKGVLMRAFGMDAMPLIVLEGKAYVPSLDPPLKENALFIRWNRDFDNPVVGQCLAMAARESGKPVLAMDDAYPRDPGILPGEAQKLARRIIAIGQEYEKAVTSARRVALIGELARLCSHDAGGSIFMSDAVHGLAGSGGLWPGLGAMLSMAVAREEAEHWKTIRLADEEIDVMADVLARAAAFLDGRRDEALAHVRQRRPSITPEALLRCASVESPEESAPLNPERTA